MSSHKSRSRSPPPRRPPYDAAGRRGSPGFRERGRHESRLEHSRSPSRDRSQSRSRGSPSREIMIDNVAPHITDADVKYELENYYRVQPDDLQDVRIIKDRNTKQSRGFGFIRFRSLAKATTFIENNHPAVYFYGQGRSLKDSEAKVKICYGKERKEADPSAPTDWSCESCQSTNFGHRTSCFRCHALRVELPPTSKRVNAGESDAADESAPSQFLLFRGLDSSVTEDLFARGVAKLNRPPANDSSVQQVPPKAKVASTTQDANLGAKDGSLRRVLLVRHRATNESWRYGFAEYASIADAQDALTRYKTFTRFTIASREVAVTYIHSGVFIPVINPTPDEEQFTFMPLNNPSIYLAYRGEEAYVSELVINDAPIESAPQTKEAAKKRKAPVDGTAPAPVKKPNSALLDYWQARGQELRGGSDHAKDNSATAAGADDEPIIRSFADPVKHRCFLCSRQFKTAEEVLRHETATMHRENLKDEGRVKHAEAKLAKHGIAHEPLRPMPQATNKPATSFALSSANATPYIDRAKQRRQQFGVVNRKGETVTPGQRKKEADGNDNDNDSDVSQSAKQPSKGASLLAKMGYTEGQGLGALGSGMTAPLSQDVYMAGVGLGAEGGKLGDAAKEAERNTKNDYGAFVDQAREKARERYKNM